MRLNEKPGIMPGFFYSLENIMHINKYLNFDQTQLEPERIKAEFKRIEAEFERIEAERKQIIQHRTGIGFKTEECFAKDAENNAILENTMDINKHLNFDQEKLVIMLSMQNTMNNRLHQSWHKQGWDWSRAIQCEVAELAEMIGWKWWKDPSVSALKQQQLEAVDIWHFGLSMMVQAIRQHIEQSGESLDKVLAMQAGLFAGHWESDLGDPEWTVWDSLDSLVVDSIVEFSFNVVAFKRLCVHLKMDFETLYKLYIGKNVLNAFRWSNGYKEGTYIKTWFGREDNEVLEEIMETVTEPDKIKQALQEQYNLVKKDLYCSVHED